MDFTSGNALLADLYKTAVTASPRVFQQEALKHLERVIGFDRAWWGIMSPGKAGFDLLSSYRHELPLAFEEHWHAVKNDDALAHDVHFQPRTTVHFNRQALHSTPGLADLNTGHDLSQALCTSVFLPNRTSFLFISLFRSGSRARAFKAGDIRLKQWLTPHLYSCWRTNLLADIERTRLPNKWQDKASAYVDRRGSIVYADSAFAEFVSQAWPAWRGGRLPHALVEMLVSNPASSIHLPIGIYVNQQQAGGLTRLDIGRPSPLDKLTRREREVARGFAQAHSYKEIAAETGLSPATVRHYLRGIYAKLAINDKAELVRLVARHELEVEVPVAIKGAFTHGLDMDYLGNG
ncbi:helix-turn-helix transcriptional regulator [Methylovorus mays]|uniref:helix-turn-helix transcriptional regulator n=1 Tax=Methylovorus mays TaxID=184077 RepID=UPI001E30EC77|nr:helix-turn-helix transcriptional regulator [Methylovorus mays]MCB5206333.1 helix-turn-helix transcriptional regulator [Methylovorus mays]